MKGLKSGKDVSWSKARRELSCDKHVNGGWRSMFCWDCVSIRFKYIKTGKGLNVD